MCPSQSKIFKYLLMVDHQSIAVDTGMLDSVVSDPRFQQRFGLLISQDHNVQRLGCTEIGYGHLVNCGLGWNLCLHEVLSI